jgi:hypothetical protein
VRTGLRQVEDRLVAGPRWNGSDYPRWQGDRFVFTSEIGTVLEPRRVDTYFESVRKACGPGPLMPSTVALAHGRHDFGSLLLALVRQPHFRSGAMPVTRLAPNLAQEAARAK